MRHHKYKSIISIIQLITLTKTNMKVRELIKKLQSEDPEREVICQQDSEGNGYSPLYDWWTGAYQADAAWGEEAGPESITDEMREQGMGDDDVMSDGVPALFLCPM